MLDNNTVSKLREMKLGVMASAFNHQLGNSDFLEMSFEERVGLMGNPLRRVWEKRATGTFASPRLVDFPAEQPDVAPRPERRILHPGG